MNTLSATDSDLAARAFETAAAQAFHSIMVTEGEIHSEGNKIVFVNNAFTDMTGFTPEEVIGKTPRFMQGAKTDQAVLDELRENLKAGSDFHGKTINYRKDGSEFMIEWKVFPIRDQHGSVTHHVAVQRDISPTQ
ncbi:MAG: PAS domain-containing protein [Candidatus Competibacteraceae bacterium]|jgi:PAS domain S-box-containing protein|nr:PAS domain-containing protein [Candidatus Competibacteraceae bacterium]